MRTSHRPYVAIVSLLVWNGILQTLHGQGIANQTNIFIDDGVEVHVQGDVTSEGFIQNQGSFFVDGNWTNTNVYQGLGSITLYGGQQQTFYNNKNAVYDLIVDGSGPKIIQGKVVITKSLALNLGIVTVADPDTLYISDGATVTGSSRSFVDGAVTHEGTGYKFFPIGTNGNYYPVELIDVTGINVATEMEAFDNVPSTDLPPSSTIYSTVYWQRKDIRGTFLNSPLSLGYTIPDNYGDRHALEIFQAQTLTSPFAPLGKIAVSYDADIDKITSGTDATENIFVIGETAAPGGLPGEFYLSTSLSPAAADPDNRLVKVFGNQLVEENFQFIVYNRWGLKVYESKSLVDMITIGWDGHQQGNNDALPSGAYPYFFRATTKAGGLIERKGIVSIVR